MREGRYAISLLGLSNLIELILLAGGFIAVCIASTGYAQLVDSYENVLQCNVTLPNGADPKAFYDIDAHTIKIADQSILMIVFGLTLITFIAHILLGLRDRYSWNRISVSFGCLCILYACAVFGISVVVACWEDKLRKRLGTIYTQNQYLCTPNGHVKPFPGSAAAAAAFGFAACLLFLSEALIRFLHLGDKVT